MDFSTIPRYPDQPDGSERETGESELIPQPLLIDERAVATFRFWRGLTLAAMVAFVPLLVLGSALGLPFGWSAVPAIAVGTIGSYGGRRFLCPRCGRTFARKWYRQNPLTRECLHCGYALPR